MSNQIQIIQICIFFFVWVFSTNFEIKFIKKSFFYFYFNHQVFYFVDPLDWILPAADRDFKNVRIKTVRRRSKRFFCHSSDIINVYNIINLKYVKDLNKSMVVVSRWSLLFHFCLLLKKAIFFWGGGRDQLVQRLWLPGFYEKNLSQLLILQTSTTQQI